MSNWKAKSDKTFEASNKLIKLSFPNQSVHCSYYSCVQLIYHILMSHYGLKIHELNEEKMASGLGTHQWLQRTMFQSLVKINPDYAADFNDDIGDLCDRRVAADYKAEIIGEEEAKQIRQKAYLTINELSKTYNYDI